MLIALAYLIFPVLNRVPCRWVVDSVDANEGLSVGPRDTRVRHCRRTVYGHVFCLFI
jgi:hypothetical protein